MDSDESYFNISVGSDGQSHKPQPFWRERRSEAVSNEGLSAYHPNALPLGRKRDVFYCDDLYKNCGLKKKSIMFIIINLNAFDVALMFSLN